MLRIDVLKDSKVNIAAIGVLINMKIHRESSCLVHLVRPQNVQVTILVFLKSYS